MINKFSDTKQPEMGSETLSGEWLGIIVDNNDPLHLGRCKVRIFEKFDKIPDELLPWAFPANQPYFAGGESKGYGSFSYPKKDHLVRIKFNNDDIYHPEYYSVENMNEKLKSEITESYVNCQVLVYDEDEDLKIIYTQNNGLMMWHKKSYVNIDKDVHVHIMHAGSTSEMHYVDGNILIKSNDEIKSVTTNNYRNASSEIIDKTSFEYFDSPSVHVGSGADQSITRCESLMQVLSTMAAIIDSKVPTTPGLTKGIVSAAQSGICSGTAKVAP